MQNKSQLNFDDLKNAIKNFDDCGSLFNLKINCVIIFRLFLPARLGKKGRQSGHCCQTQGVHSHQQYAPKHHNIPSVN